MSDYFEAIDYVKHKQKLKEGDQKNQDAFERGDNEHVEFRETQRQNRQKKMFKIDRVKREETYFSIYENLTISSMSDGLSCLRRLELRYLPLDPLLVTQIFKALKVNIIL